MVEANQGRPIRPMSAFFIFCSQVRGDLKTRHPDMSVMDLTKEIAKEWKEMSDEAREEYVILANEQKKRYQKEMDDYAAGLGNNLLAGKKKDEGDAGSDCHDD